MKKRIVGLLMAAVTVMTGITACGSTGGENSASPDSQEQQEKEPEQENGAAEENTLEGGDAQASEMSTDPITFTIFVDHSWFWFDKWGEDPVSQEITRRTGVSFDVIRATDGQQLPLLVASGDLPDIVYTSSNTMLAMLSDADVCYSYTDLVDEYGVDIHAADSEIRNNTVGDGKYYCLRNAYTSQETIDEGNTLLSGGTKTIAYRKDIWEEIGSPEIKTLDDLENALLAAKELHPDIIPLLNDGNLWYFAEQIGINGDGSVGYDAEGKPCYVLCEEGIKDYFAILNRFAREGLISAEAQTYSFDKFHEVRNSGKSFMQLRCVDEAANANADALSAGSGLEWQLLTNDLSDDAKVSVNTGIGWSGTFISKNCKDPERAIQFISWCRSEEGRKLGSWGIQGEHWDYNENGETIYTESYQSAIAEGKLKQDDFGIGVWIFGDRGDENAFIDHNATDQTYMDQVARLQSAVAHTVVMSELYPCIPTEGDELNLYNALNDMYNSELQKIIFAETDEEYQSAVDKLYEQAESMGMYELNEWMAGQLNK